MKSVQKKFLIAALRDESFFEEGPVSKMVTAGIPPKKGFLTHVEQVE